MSRFNAKVPATRKPRSSDLARSRGKGKESRGHMEERQYDLIFICRPDTPEPDIDKVIATLDTPPPKGRANREDREVGP